MSYSTKAERDIFWHVTALVGVVVFCVWAFSSSCTERKELEARCKGGAVIQQSRGGHWVCIPGAYR